MQLLLFVSDDGSPDGTGPILFVESHPGSALPPNPRGFDWRYFATISASDNLFAVARDEGLADLEAQGFHIAHRLVAS